jgi:glycosyltransferase involved in cell wall biosynthesis
MRIAILTPTFSHYSGIDRVAEQQAKDYSKKGHKVTVFSLESTIEPKGYEVEVIGMPKHLIAQRIYRLFFFIDFKKIKKYSEKLRHYDIIISHFYPMNLIASKARKKFNIKYSYHNHGIGYSHLFRTLLEIIYMKLFSFFNRISLKNVDSAVSISKFLQKELKKETGLYSKVVYDEIDKKRFKKGINGSKIRKKLGIKTSDKVLFFIGRLSPHKNVHVLLNIFKLVNKEIPDAKLIIAGKPTFKDYYRHLRNTADKNVIFTGFIDDKDLPYYYAASDIYVTASLWEGFNLPAAEAQACGKKVVAFNIGSHPEIVKNGILIKKGDIQKFADTVIKILR